jgi:tetratricopeptide (TPR) repeat protein
VIKEQHLGPDHFQVSVTLTHLGSLDETVGDYARAHERFERAAKVGRAALGDDHPEVAHALAGLSRARLHLGRDDALEPAEIALAIYERVGAGPSELAGARFSVADALVRSLPGGTRACARPSEACTRARALVDQARADYEAAGHLGEAGTATIDTWLAAYFGHERDHD